MSCDTFLQQIIAEPNQLDPVISQHIEQCSDCKTAFLDSLKFDGALKSAIEIPVPPHLIGAIVNANLKRLQPRPVYRRVSMAMAAMVLLFVGFSLFSTHRFNAYNDHLIAHIEREPQALLAHDNFTVKKLNPMLASMHYKLKPKAVRAEFAKICIVDGKQVLHMVYNNSFNEPITVLVLPHTISHWKKYFQRKGYRGEIIPLPSGFDMIVIGKERQNIEGVQLHLMSNIEPANT